MLNMFPVSLTFIAITAKQTVIQFWFSMGISTVALFAFYGIVSVMLQLFYIS